MFSGSAGAVPGPGPGVRAGSGRSRCGHGAEGPGGRCRHSCGGDMDTLPALALTHGLGAAHRRRPRLRGAESEGAAGRSEGGRSVPRPAPLPPRDSLCGGPAPVPPRGRSGAAGPSPLSGAAEGPARSFPSRQEVQPGLGAGPRGEYGGSAPLRCPSPAPLPLPAAGRMCLAAPRSPQRPRGRPGPLSRPAPSRPAPTSLGRGA